MGAYHFTAKVISRSGGAKSVVRAAAYRAAERLEDRRLGTVEDYTRKADVVATAILAPEGAPAWVLDRQELWNRVEARERRRDAQLAQEFEINLPRELTDAQNWQLIRDWAQAELVAKGRVCDLSYHRHQAADGAAHPHAHCLMPMRFAEGESFGAKHPDVDRATFFQNKHRLEELRASWCEFSRTRAAELGVDLGPEWDHRSFAERGVDQEAQPKRGATSDRMERQGNETARAAEVLAATQRNGERLLADPGLALKALTAQQSTFTEHDLARWIHRHSDDDQFQRIYGAAKALAVPLGPDDRGQTRYSSAEMVALERRMLEDAATMAGRGGHLVRSAIVDRVLDRSRLSDEQQIAARAILTGEDLTCLVGLAGAGKSTMLNEVRLAYEAQGYRVQGASLSGIAAENLEAGSGIKARTLHSLAGSWSRDREQLTDRDVLVVDEAGMIGSRQLAHVLDHARQAGAKVVLVGDPEQLQSIAAGAAFRAIQEHTGAAELTEVRRQQVEWQRLATKELATAATGAALDRYTAAGAVHVAQSAEAAQAAVVARWEAAQVADPEKSRLMLAHRRVDVQALNSQARESRRAAGALAQQEIEFDTVDGVREFAAGDRFIFLKNDRDMGVKNGTLGTVERAEDGWLRVRTDAGRQVAVDALAYPNFDHGYAVTVHKAQGVTVDQAFVLATGGFDRHLSYVAMSRHRERLDVVYSGQEFSSADKLKATLGRRRAKDVTTDYSDAEAVMAAAREQLRPERPGMSDKDAAREALLARARAANAERARSSQERTRSRENDLEL